jgi:hypothetical protein
VPPTYGVILEFVHVPRADVRPLFGSVPVLIGLVVNDEMLYPNGIRIRGSTTKREPHKQHSPSPNIPSSCALPTPGLPLVENDLW